MSNPLQNWGNGKVTFELFPQEILELDRELQTEYHPKLAFLNKFGSDDIDMKLAQIAAYCEVMLDGVYTLENRMQLCKILTEKLILLREYPQAQKIILLN
jgi:hypothetical protein